MCALANEPRRRLQQVAQRPDEQASSVSTARKRRCRQAPHLGTLALRWCGVCASVQQRFSARAHACAVVFFGLDRTPRPLAPRAVGRFHQRRRRDPLPAVKQARHGRCCRACNSSATTQHCSNAAPLLARAGSAAAAAHGHNGSVAGRALSSSAGGARPQARERASKRHHPQLSPPPGGVRACACVVAPRTPVCACQKSLSSGQPRRPARGGCQVRVPLLAPARGVRVQPAAAACASRGTWALTAAPRALRSPAPALCAMAAGAAGHQSAADRAATLVQQCLDKIVAVRARLRFPRSASADCEAYAALRCPVCAWRRFRARRLGVMDRSSRMPRRWWGRCARCPRRLRLRLRSRQAAASPPPAA